MAKRKITKKDRQTYRKNAIKGTEKYSKMNPGARKASRNRSKPKWGFDGKSPSTKKRTYKNKRK